MKRLLIVSLLALSGCVVVRPGGLAIVEGSDHPHGGPPGQTKDKEKEHPHGGPPGQSKHKHGKKCGHAHQKHKGRVVYVVDGHHEDEDGIVIVIKD